MTVQLRGHLRHLYEVAREQGWKVEPTTGGKVRWSPPDVGQAPVITGREMDESGPDLRNVVAQMRHAGLKIGDKVSPEPKAELSSNGSKPTIDRFTLELAGLIDQEIERRSQNLMDQVTALKNENRELRERLAEVETDVEERARKVAADAVENFLASRRGPR